MIRPSRALSRGFTLLELLIGLAVTAAVVALMFAGVGVIGRSEERNHRVIERSERMLVVSQWLGRKFDTLRPLSRRDFATPAQSFRPLLRGKCDDHADGDDCQFPDDRVPAVWRLQLHQSEHLAPPSLCS